MEITIEPFANLDEAAALYLKRKAYYSIYC